MFMVAASVYAAADVATKLYDGKKYHYTIQYPADWHVYDHDDGVVVFKKLGLRSVYPTSVNIQTIYTKKAKGTYANVKELMDDFTANAKSDVTNVTFSERKPIILIDTNGVKIHGEEITMSFEAQGTKLKQWQVMVITDDGRLFQAWGYRAAETNYELDLPAAKNMLNSWVFE
jgi:hypothetical protein